MLGGMFMSPLFVPCNKPPHGKLNAFDLTTGKLLWSKALGTARDSGPMGMRSRLPFTIGTVTIGGAITTQSGLTFIAATQDRMLRAFNTATGEELWHADLPSGGQATPMTYMSDNGRQYVVISSGGGGGAQSTLDDYVVAFALPQTTTP
jgi:glucose dehydrogenase